MQIGNYRFDEDVAMGILQNIAQAVVILIITWALAKAAKWAFTKLVDKVSFFQRATGTGTSFGASLGKIVSLLIWLFGLLAVLNVFQLTGVMDPVQTLLNNVMDAVPGMIGAALIFFIGLMVAGIVRDIVVTTLQTVDFDKWVNRGGAESVTGNSAISNTLGTIVYVLIVIPVAIAALNVLGIEAISAPASEMLNMILSAIPNIIGAAVLLGIGYIISKFVAQILSDVLTGLGVDRSISATGLVGETTSASSIIARVVQVAIILFFAIAATRLLGFPELTAIVNEVLGLGGRVVFGAVVIGFGFLIANLLSKLVAGADGQSTAGTIVRWATIILFTFMGLSYTGVGDIITETAFSAVVIGASVAGALAFGLGGREWAGRKLEQMDSSLSGDAPAAKKPAAKKAAPKSSKPLPPGA